MLLLAVDNAILSPALQTPIKLGADIVIHSATKYIDGQGRCLAGAVLATGSISPSALSLAGHTALKIYPYSNCC
jgi:cystathionine beta-lyase/cystathionine gamma-synthase